MVSHGPTIRRSARWLGRTTWLCAAVAVLAFGLGIATRAVWHEWRIAKAHRNLGDLDPVVRLTAVVLLQENGEDYSADLIRLLEHSDYDVRAFATESLATSRPIPDAVIPVLMANLRAPQADELTRCRAAQYLGDYGQLGVGPFSDLEQSVIDVLETTLAERRDNARLCAMGALLKFARRDTSIAAVFDRQQNDSDERLRLHALMSLNELGLRTSQEALTVLLVGAASPDKDVRRDALAWLIAIDKSQVDPSLIIAELEAIQGRFPQLADEIDPTVTVIRANHMAPNAP